MSLIKLSGIGKIYVSENSVAVGVRGVNLAFDRGEFVAVTGASGSGKSTLLNVLSGMDTYEEGEMYVEGEPTSHYTQSDWEAYRNKYISFVFQDYNIVDSFTVLENVELALMSIQNPVDRRKRALKLIERVGLASHAKHKGSRLSGGQKQRTVIARALAKDAPIILADEPTGNLDSKSSLEILQLLKEVSKDKLVIVVTHSFDEIEPYATRHIRIHDGGIDADQILSKTEAVNLPIKEESYTKKKKLANGIQLGFVKFKSMPKFSFFMCLLMIISTFGVFLITSSCFSSLKMFERTKLFNHKDGRLVIIRRDNMPITDDEVKKLVDKVGAESYLRLDCLMDQTLYVYSSFTEYEFGFTYGEDIKPSIGRAPKDADEVLLSVPISLKPILGEDKIEKTKLGSFFNDYNVFSDYEIVGVHYYYDNTVKPMVIFTENGFMRAATAYYLESGSKAYIENSVVIEPKTSGEAKTMESYSVEIVVSDKLSGREVAFSGDLSEIYNKCLNDPEGSGVLILIHSRVYSTVYSKGAEAKTVENLVYKSLEDIGYTDEHKNSTYDMLGDVVYVSEEIEKEINDLTSEKYYSQASLFFGSDKEAEKAIPKVSEEGYMGVLSDEYTISDIDVITRIIVSFMMFALWWGVIVFIAFLVRLCTTRSITATKGDLAILRSMGIDKTVIKISTYAQMIITLIPAYIFVAIAAVVIYTTPTLNGLFVYLHALEYIVISIGMLIITLRVTRLQSKKLFGQSVKNTLRGGENI